MVTIPLPTDPTIDAIDAAIEAIENATPQRPYLGMSQIGEPCARKLWFSFRHAKAKDKKAKLVKCAIDGHNGEELQSNRLRMVDGVTLETIDSSTGKQFTFSWFYGHVHGNMDGKIIGLIQAPKTNHVWENKNCNQKKYDDFTKCKEKFGDKECLKNWDIIYYGQAQLYMHFSGFTRHYITVNLPGNRETQSCRTNYDEKYALQLLDKAEKIIFTDSSPPRISDNPSWYQCKWCDYYKICHTKEELPQVNCRTCLHSTPERNGTWSCAKLNETIENVMPCGGEKHLYLPDMLGSKAVEATDNSVIYADGRVNYEGGMVE